MKIFYLPILLLLSACAVAPSSIVKQPRTASPQVPMQAVVPNGAIFQSAAYRPMFEDRRARIVGDILTITISETTSAVKSNSSSASKSGNASASVPTVSGLPLKFLQGTSLTASGSSKFEDKDAAAASNTFTGTIGVTVIDVLSNGNLVVAGEKQLALDKGTEFIRISGVINPDHIALGNTITSSQVSDARVEYRTNTQIDRASLIAAMTRVFQSIVPF